MSNLLTANYIGDAARQGSDPSVPAFPQSYILAQSAVPIILLPSGTINASGQFTLGTALPYIPIGTVQVYVFAGVGLTAGLYFATFSSTTVCQLTGNPTTTSGAYAGGTAEVNLVSVTVPAGALGANGKLRIAALWSNNNSAGAKTPNAKYAGQLIANANSGNNMTTNTALRQYGELLNRGAQNANVVQPYIGATGASNGTAFTSIDTSVSQVLNFTGQIATASDYIILEGYSVELLPSK